MKTIPHYCSLTPQSLNQLAKGLKTKVIDNKIVYIPEEVGNGYIYFTEITAHISVLYFEVTLKTPTNFKRLCGSNDLVIFHFDFSENANLIKINNVDYQIGSLEQLDVAIIENDLESSFRPAINKKTSAIRLIVNKNILKDFVKTYLKEITNYKNRKTSYYHYGNLDSNSILLMENIKNKKPVDISFDFLIKGTSLKLFGNLISQFYNTNSRKKVTEVDYIALEKTKQYLQNNLSSPFPSITFLAGMASMSESKYKTLFKNCYRITPNHFFIAQKMQLGKKLLQSGNFYTLTEILYELNYSKLSYFAKKYNEIYKRKLNDDFVRKKISNDPK